MATGDVWAVRPHCYFTDQLGINVTHWVTISEVGTGTDPQAAADYFSAAFAPMYKALMTTRADFIGLTAQKVLPLPATTAAVSIDGAGAGTQGDHPLPRQATGLLSLYAATAGRRNRGRMYIPFPGTLDEQDDATPGGGYHDSLITLGLFLLDPQVVPGTVLGNSATMRACILHRDTGTVSTIVRFVARDKYATQRRRGSYGRSNPRPF